MDILDRSKSKLGAFDRLYNLNPRDAQIKQCKEYFMKPMSATGSKNFVEFDVTPQKIKTYEIIGTKPARPYFLENKVRYEIFFEELR